MTIVSCDYLLDIFTEGRGNSNKKTRRTKKYILDQKTLEGKKNFLTIKFSSNVINTRVRKHMK